MKKVFSHWDAIDAVIQTAGEKLLELWPGGEGSRDALGVEEKSDRSLVSVADYTSNQILTDGLTALFPEIPVVSEEALQDPGDKPYWLIDPLDGTARFLEGKDDFVVLVAYIDQERRASAGWMFFPALGEFFSAIGREVRSGGTPLTLSSGSPLRENSVYVRTRDGQLTSGEHLAPPVLREEIHSGTTARRILTGGLAGAIMELGRLGSWDVAAPAALVQALGGGVVNELGKPLTFSKPEISEGWIITGHQEALPELLELYAQVGLVAGAED